MTPTLANLAVLAAATLLALFWYLKSAGPAALARRIGPAAYRRCTVYRLVAAGCLLLAASGYVAYRRFPLTGPLPVAFPWPRWISLLAAAVLGLPSGWLWLRGVVDAGKESLVVRREHVLFGDIYRRIRHPQAAGELPWWWVLALLLDSPFLALYSLVWVPAYLAMCLAEERDLVLRYGEAYLAYRRSTGFIIPRRRP